MGTRNRQAQQPVEPTEVEEIGSSGLPPFPRHIVTWKVDYKNPKRPPRRWSAHLLLPDTFTRGKRERSKLLPFLPYTAQGASLYSCRPESDNPSRSRGFTSKGGLRTWVQRSVI